MTAATAPLVEKGAGKSKGFKDGLDEDGHAPSSPTEVKHSVEPLNTRRRGEEDDGLIHHDSDSKSPTNCPVSVLCGPDSGTNFTGSSSGGSSSSNNNSSNSGGCCSGNVTEVEVEGDEGCCSGKMRKVMIKIEIHFRVFFSRRKRPKKLVLGNF
ncbi:hypothetical protein GLYMA_07G041250v4 [Glycine max]|nr:hypothetical protein GLYMA_07G041250v4 [Glycine max]